MSVVHILLIEDNAGDILLIRLALEENQIAHHLKVLRDGAEALAFMRRMGQRGYEPCPDVLLLDMNLPKVDGPQVLSEFRKHPACVTTPVIVVTSSDTPKERERMRDLGVAHYFKKPSDLNAYLMLGSLVREIVARSRAESGNS